MGEKIRQMFEKEYNGMEFTLTIHKESGDNAIEIQTDSSVIMQMYFLINVIISIYPTMYRELKVLNEIYDGYGLAEDLTQAMRKAMCRALEDDE